MVLYCIADISLEKQTYAYFDVMITMLIGTSKHAPHKNVLRTLVLLFYMTCVYLLSMCSRTVEEKNGNGYYICIFA